MEKLRQNLDDVNRQLQTFGKTLQRIQKKSMATDIEKLKKQYETSQLHVRVLQRMLEASNHSRNELKQKFQKLFEEVGGIREILF